MGVLPHLPPTSEKTSIQLHRLQAEDWVWMRPRIRHRKLQELLPKSGTARLIITLLAFIVAEDQGINACECSDSAGAMPSEMHRPRAATSEEHAAALGSYAERAAALRLRALRNGTVSYNEVIEAAYGAAIVDPRVLHEKASWRARVGTEFAFIADYSMGSDGAVVRPLNAVPDLTLHSTLVAQYESVLHVIGIAPIASDFAIFHEAGHALQREALRARGGPSGRRAEAPGFLLHHMPRDSQADPTTLRRLRYLCSQDEFEVRLQDLNRFHALLVEPRPIMSPMDALRALAALGMPLDYEETRRAFVLVGQNLERDAFEHSVSATPIRSAAVVAAFEDARELDLMRRLALRVDPASWPRMLAKIIFEAPGHL